MDGWRFGGYVDGCLLWCVVRWCWCWCGGCRFCNCVCLSNLGLVGYVWCLVVWFCWICWGW